MTKHRRQLFGILIGVAITPIAVGLAVASAGGGHGSYVLAKLFFPFTMFLTRFAGDTITYPLVGLAVAQFPFYGLVAASREPIRAALALSLTHAIFAVICFSSLLPTFP